MKAADSTQSRGNNNQTAKRQKISERVRFRVFRRDSFTCQYCGRVATEAKLSIDHVIPVSKGGTNDFNNLTTACIVCNRGKSDEDIIVNQQNKPQRKRYLSKSGRREIIWLGDDLTKKIMTAIAMRYNKKKIIRETGAKAGTVKNRLRRLEAQGYIEPHRELMGGIEVVVYIITSKGKQSIVCAEKPADLEVDGKERREGIMEKAERKLEEFQELFEQVKKKMESEQVGIEGTSQCSNTIPICTTNLHMQESETSCP